MRFDLEALLLISAIVRRQRVHHLHCVMCCCCICVCVCLCIITSSVIDRYNGNRHESMRRQHIFISHGRARKLSAGERFLYLTLSPTSLCVLCHFPVRGFSSVAAVDSARKRNGVLKWRRSKRAHRPTNERTFLLLHMIAIQVFFLSTT